MGKSYPLRFPAGSQPNLLMQAQSICLGSIGFIGSGCMDVTTDCSKFPEVPYSTYHEVSRAPVAVSFRKILVGRWSDAFFGLSPAALSRSA